MAENRYSGDALWERIERAVEYVKDRMRRVTEAMENAGVAYAIVVRNPRDVDDALNREDLPAAIAALQAAGFIFRQAAGVTMFLGGPGAKARDVFHVVFTGEKVRETYPEAVPSIEQVKRIKNVRTLPLELRVRVKLTSYRRKAQVHLLDMPSVGFIDETWLERLSPVLRTRLQTVIDDPDG